MGSSHTDSLLVRRISDGLTRALNALGHLLVRLDAPHLSQTQHMGTVPALPQPPPSSHIPPSPKPPPRSPSIDHNTTPGHRTSPRLRGRRSHSNITTAATTTTTTTIITAAQDNKSPPASPLSSSDDDSVAARHRRTKLLQQKQRHQGLQLHRNSGNHRQITAQHKQTATVQPSKDTKFDPFVQGPSSQSNIAPTAATTADLLRQNSSPVVNSTTTSAPGDRLSPPTVARSLSSSLRRHPSLPPPDLPSSFHVEPPTASAFRRLREPLESPNDQQSVTIQNASALRRHASLEGIQHTAPQSHRTVRSQRSQPNRRASLEVPTGVANDWDAHPVTRHHRASLDSATLQKAPDSIDRRRREPLEPLPASLFRRGGLSRRPRTVGDLDPESSTSTSRTCPEQVQTSRRKFEHGRLSRHRRRHSISDGCPVDGTLHVSDIRSDKSISATVDVVFGDTPENHSARFAVSDCRAVAPAVTREQTDPVVFKSSVDVVFNPEVETRPNLEPIVSDSSAAVAGQSSKAQDKELLVSMGPQLCSLPSNNRQFDTSPASSRSSLLCEITGAEVGEARLPVTKSPAVSPILGSRRVRFAEDM